MAIVSGGDCNPESRRVHEDGRSRLLCINRTDAHATVKAADALIDVPAGEVVVPCEHA